MLKKSVFPAILLILCCLALSSCGNITRYGELLSTHLTQSTEAALLSGASTDSLPKESAETLASSPALAIPETETLSKMPLYTNYDYYFPSLTGDLLENFQALYQGIQNFEAHITLPQPTDSQTVNDLMFLLLNNCPELMQLDSVWTEQSNLFSQVTIVSPSYRLDPETYQQQYEAVCAVLSDLHRQLDNSTAYEIELFLYQTIIRNCVYTTETEHCGTVYGALLEGYAKCDGRAKAMVWALRSFGIRSCVMTGNEHAWVMLQLNGFDYNADPTYDDIEEDGVQHEIVYSHFNVPESAIASDPYPTDDFYQRYGYPQTVRWDDNYHVKNGWYLKADDDVQGIFDSLLGQIRQAGSGIINLRFETYEQYTEAAASYKTWLQEYLNNTFSSCSIVTYDYHSCYMLVFQLTFS